MTTVNEENHLNWVYVHRNTHEVRYGIKAQATENHTGPWDCTPIDKRLTLFNWEGFVAVQESEAEDLWALYFDKHDNGLSTAGFIGDETTQGRRYRMLEVQLLRKESPL